MTTVYCTYSEYTDVYLFMSNVSASFWLHNVYYYKMEEIKVYTVQVHTQFWGETLFFKIIYVRDHFKVKT